MDNEIDEQIPQEVTVSGGQEPTDTCTYGDTRPVSGLCRVCGAEHYIADPGQCGKG
jgi:hypothetical protein